MFIKAIVNGEIKELDIPVVPSMQLHDEKNAELFSLMNQTEGFRKDISSITAVLSQEISKTPTLSKKAAYEHSDLSSSQGGCTDGTYIYFYVRGFSDSDTGRLVKMRRSNYEVVKTKSLSLYHGNDMTFNPDTGLLYVATMQQPTANSSIIKVIDPETLTITESITVPMYISAIAYEPTMKYFVGGIGGMTKYVFTLTLKENGTHEYKAVKTLNLSSSPCANAGYLSQGIACDAAFIYHCWADSKYYIEIFDWLGNYKGVISGSSGYEIEWVDKTSKYGFITGHYDNSNPRTHRIYTFTV